MRLRNRQSQICSFTPKQFHRAIIDEFSHSATLDRYELVKNYFTTFRNGINKIYTRKHAFDVVNSI